jgi:Mg2+/Co2+ transporter CorC
MAVAVLQERGGTSINVTDEEVRAALSGEIVAEWDKWERELRRLSDHAVQMIDQREAQRQA